jgi:hypothetical protein
VASCNGCFEASWDENGALCIAHVRVTEVLERLVTLAGYDQVMAERLFKERYADAPGDAPYVCVRGKELPDALARSLLFNRSRIHRCKPTWPAPKIKDCHTTLPDSCPIPPPPGSCP